MKTGNVVSRCVLVLTICLGFQPALACTPLNIQPGHFYTNTHWESAPSKSFDGKTLTLTTSGPNPGLFVQQGSKSVFHQQSTNHVLQYKILGNKYLVILDYNTSTGLRDVLLVNFSTWTEVTILSVNAASTVSPPAVDPSPGNGVAFLAYGLNGTQYTDVAIHRSDTGGVLCSVGHSFEDARQVLAEATGTELIIHYFENNQSKEKRCPHPVGNCKITPASQTFPSTVVGGCSVVTPTKQFTIKNDGTDCLTVNSITNTPPFRVKSTSQSLPAILAENETVQVTVELSPTTAGNWNAVALPVSTTPARGDDKLLCSGTASNAAPSVQFNRQIFNFGNVPVNTPAPNQTLRITNNGSAPLSVSVPLLNISGFTCAGYNGILDCGQQQTVLLGYTPPDEGYHSAILTIVTNATNSPHEIQLNGYGCIARPTIEVPPTAPINFGPLEQGFRTVRFLEIQNSGNDTLTFAASVEGTDAALFGLPTPGGSVTTAPGSRAYEVHPVDRCGSGPTGSGRTIVPVCFYADASAGSVDASLVIHSTNADNFPPTKTWTFPLQGQITAPIALDVGLVVDRSGSMTDPLGSRQKMDAALAASKLFVELLRPDFDDRVAVVRFNHIPETVVSITPVSSTTSPTQNDILQNVTNDIPPAQGNTAIAGGALVASKEVETPRPSSPPQLRKALLVLTDGIENTAFEDPAGSNQWVSILGGRLRQPPPNYMNKVNTTPVTIASDIDVYAIGLGKNSDINPTELNSLATPGRFFHVNQNLSGKMYFQLEKYYTQIFMDLVGTSSVHDPMYDIMPGQTHQIEFDVLRGDVSVLVVLYDWQGKRLPFYCLSPRDEIVDPSTLPPGYQIRTGATELARFVEFRFPPKNPQRYSGRWKVIIKHPKQVYMGMPQDTNRRSHHKAKGIGFLPPDSIDYPTSLPYGIAIGVGSNFRMLPMVSPGPIHTGEPILLASFITEADLPVTDCDVTVEIQSPQGLTRTIQLNDDGLHADGDAQDGEYAHLFTHTHVPGTYHCKFKAIGRSRDGEPVLREALRDKAVLKWKPEKPQKDTDACDWEACCRELLQEIRELKRIIQKAGSKSRPTLKKQLSD